MCRIVALELNVQSMIKCVTEQCFVYLVKIERNCEGHMKFGGVARMGQAKALSWRKYVESDLWQLCFLLLSLTYALLQSTMVLRLDRAQDGNLLGTVSPDPSRPEGTHPQYGDFVLKLLRW